MVLFHRKNAAEFALHQVEQLEPGLARAASPPSLTTPA
jgi:hypothetical protein